MHCHGYPAVADARYIGPPEALLEFDRKDWTRDLGTFGRGRRFVVRSGLCARLDEIGIRVVETNARPAGYVDVGRDQLVEPGGLGPRQQSSQRGFEVHAGRIGAFRNPVERFRTPLIERDQIGRASCRERV